VSSHLSALLVQPFGEWNVFIADLRNGLHGRVVQNGGGPRRALGLALEDALAVRSHGWIDLDTPRREQRAGDDEQSVESGESVDSDYAYYQPPHGFDDLHTHRQLDSCGYVLCWK
jgi:hypothetical protein